MEPRKKPTYEERLIAAQEMAIESLKKLINAQESRIKHLEEQVQPELRSPEQYFVESALQSLDPNERQISLADVERMAYDSNTPEDLAKICQRVLMTARAMMRGEDPTFPAQVIPAYRILFIKTTDNVSIYVD